MTQLPVISAGEGTHSERRAMAAPREGDALGRRLIGAVVAICCATVLGLAAWLEPAPSGIGTHRMIIGLPPCGWVAGMNMPCPTCGMTTAFAHAADGNLLASFRAQPFGALLALFTACAFLVGGYVAATGSRVGWMLRRLWFRHAIWILTIAALLAWGYKILDFKGSLE